MEIHDALKIVRALANGLEQWILDRERLRTAQQAAWLLARDEFCWDLESRKLLHIMEQVSSERTRSLACGQTA